MIFHSSFLRRFFSPSFFVPPSSSSYYHQHGTFHHDPPFSLPSSPLSKLSSSLSAPSYENSSPPLVPASFFSTLPSSVSSTSPSHLSSSSPLLPPSSPSPLYRYVFPLSSLFVFSSFLGYNFWNPTTSSFSFPSKTQSSANFSLHIPITDELNNNKKSNSNNNMRPVPCSVTSSSPLIRCPLGLPHPHRSSAAMSCDYINVANAAAWESSTIPMGEWYKDCPFSNNTKRFLSSSSAVNTKEQESESSPSPFSLSDPFTDNKNNDNDHDRDNDSDNDSANQHFPNYSQYFQPPLSSFDSLPLLPICEFHYHRQCHSKIRQLNLPLIICADMSLVDEAPYNFLDPMGKDRDTISCKWGREGKRDRREKDILIFR